MSTAELSLQEAALAYAKAKQAVDEHEGPKSGDAFAAKLAVWRGTIHDLTEASIRHATHGAAA